MRLLCGSFEKREKRRGLALFLGVKGRINFSREIKFDILRSNQSIKSQMRLIYELVER